MQIKCTNLSVGYNNIPLHENINFSIPSGSYTCIVGENGAGKSTLMKTILGLNPPISGEFKVGDSENKIDIGYLPQQTQIQKDFPASVFEVVLSGCLNKIGNRPFYSKKEKELALQMIEKLNISHLVKKSYSKLSGGQQQRTLLARALCATDKILLLDEPTSGLDEKATSELYSIIKKLNNEGTSILMITHSLNENIEDANYVLLVKEEIKLYTKEEYKERENGR